MGLAHAVEVEGRLSIVAGLVEDGLGLELRRGGEGEVGEVRLARTLGHLAQHVLAGVFGEIAVVFLVQNLGCNGGFDAVPVQDATQRLRRLSGR